MNANLTEIACVIDRSGSMSSICSDAIGGFNSFLVGQQAQPGEARLTLVLFDHEYDVRYRGAPLHAVQPLDTTIYVPRGTTALLDAVGRTIDDLGLRLHHPPEAERPSKVIVAILTDGAENASKDYTYQRVAQMIRHQRERYSWEFIFLAANQDAIAAASRLAIDAQDTVTFAATGNGVRAAYSRLDADVSARRRRR